MSVKEFAKKNDETKLLSNHIIFKFLLNKDAIYASFLIVVNKLNLNSADNLKTRVKNIIVI